MWKVKHPPNTVKDDAQNFVGKTATRKGKKFFVSKTLNTQREREIESHVKHQL